MKSYPFTSQVTYDEQELPQYDRAVDSAFLRDVFKQYFSNGVFYRPSTGMQVEVDSGMQVGVLPGAVHIQGAIGIEDSRRTLQVQAADTQDRIDTVVARLDLSLAARSIDLYIVKGAPSTAPSPPALTRNATVWELGLANLFVAKGVTSITQQRITDTRLDTARCGTVAAPLDPPLDTDAYFEQLQALIDDLEETIAGIETGSEVMLRTVYDSNGDGVVDKARNANVAQDSELLATHSPEWYAPPGMIVPYGGAAAPAGWLLCDGSAVSRTAYADLFAVIGTTYGAGNGSTTFTLPDLRGRVAAGANASNALASRAGADSKQIARANLPAEKLRIADNGSWIVDTTQFGVHSGKPLSLGNNRSEAEYLYTEPMGSGTAFDVRQNTIYLNYIIKY